MARPHTAPPTPLRPIDAERARLRTRIQIAAAEGGRHLAPLAECREIGLSSLLVTAAVGVEPGTEVQFSLRLPNGLPFAARGRVARCCTTLHLAPFGPTRGREDDAIFEIELLDRNPDRVWPVAALLLLQQSPKRRRPPLPERTRGHPAGARLA